MASVAPPFQTWQNEFARRGPPRVDSFNPVGGNVGETADFKGAGFLSLTGVDFGGVGLPSFFPFISSWPIPYTTEVNGGSPTVYTRAQRLDSSVTSVVPRIRNAYQSGAVGTITSNVALNSSDGAGGAGPNLQTWLGATIPGNSDWNGGSVNIMPRAADKKIVLLQSLAPAATVACSVTPLVHGTYSAGTSTVNPAPAPSAADPTPISWVNFDYQTNRPRWVFMTDSIPCGVNGVIGFEASFPYLLAVNKDYAVQQLGLPGSALATWADYLVTSAAWWAAMAPVDSGVGLWLQPGVNDVTGNTAVSMEGWMTTIV